MVGSYCYSLILFTFPFMLSFRYLKLHCRVNFVILFLNFFYLHCTQTPFMNHAKLCLGVSNINGRMYFFLFWSVRFLLLDAIYNIFNFFYIFLTFHFFYVFLLFITKTLFSFFFFFLHISKTCT